MSQLSQFTKLPSAHSSQKPCRNCPNLQNSHLPTHYRNHVANVPTYKCFTPICPLTTETMSQLSQFTKLTSALTLSRWLCHQARLWNHRLRRSLFSTDR